ncbi:MAG: GumC family protein, partial [Nitrospirales bacterium]
TATGSDLATQTEVIRSFPVVEEVAQRLGMVPPTLSASVEKSADYLNTIYELQTSISTSLEGPTSILRIAVVAPSPELAAKIANTTAEAYRLYNIRSRNRLVSDSRDFVESQLAELQRKLHESEEALRDFKEREGQVFLDEEAKAALDNFTKLEAEVDRVSRLKDETIRQIAVLEGTAQGGLAGSDRIFTDDPASVLGQLNNRLLDLEQEREALLINYTPRHPQVRELDRRIINAKDDMIRELESKLDSLNERESALRAQIARYRERYFGFPKAAIELARIERDVKVNSDLYATLRVKHQELLIKGAEQIEEVTIIEPAVAPSQPVNSPSTGLNLAVGSLMGVFLGIVLAFLRESFDTSIGTIEGVEEYLKVPVLGVIPQFTEKELREAAAQALPSTISVEVLDIFSKLGCLFDPKSLLSEGFRSLRTNLQFASRDRNIKTILFTSAGLGEGKTTTIVNLALTFAQDGKRVLLVDADLRRPIIHRRLGLQREPGLTEVLMGSAPWRTAVRTVTDLMLGPLGVDQVMNNPALDNLNVLTSGSLPPNPAEFLNSASIIDLVAELREEYDLVLFDAPPILPIADAITISSKMDSAVLVYQVG